VGRWSAAGGRVSTGTADNLPENLLIERLSANSGYVAAFKDAFHETQIDRRQVEQALATFERSILPTRAPFDRWLDGGRTAINESAARGFDLFNGKANCAACHNGWAFTDSSFHDIGSADNDNIGRGNLFPNSVTLRYAFKTPTLRDVARRGPYMHDGSVSTLPAVIELYDRGGIDRPSRAAEIRRLGLSSIEKADLIAFLETLTGRPDIVPSPVLPRWRKRQRRKVGMVRQHKRSCPINVGRNWTGKALRATSKPNQLIPLASLRNVGVDH